VSVTKAVTEQLTVCRITGCRASATHVEEGVFTRASATVFLLSYLSIETARMDPQGSHIGVRMNNNNNNQTVVVVWFD